MEIGLEQASDVKKSRSDKKRRRNRQSLNTSQRLKPDFQNLILDETAPKNPKTKAEQTVKQAAKFSDSMSEKQPQDKTRPSNIFQMNYSRIDAKVQSLD